MRLFTILALALAIGLATAVSPFASSQPDGLETGRRRTRRSSSTAGSRRSGALARSPTTRSRAIENERLATGLAGFVGTLGVFALGYGIATVARRRPAAHERRRLHAAGVAGDPHSPIHRLDPRAKLIGLAGVTLVAVSTPLRAWPAYAACARR